MSDWEAIESAEDWGRRGLSRGGRRIGRAALEGFLCDGSPLRPPEESWCTKTLDAYDLGIGNASIVVRLGVRVLLMVLEWLPLFVIGKPSRMSRLSLADRVAYFEALERHRWGPLAMLLVATKIPLTIAAYEEGEALRMTGFDRPSTISRRARAS